MHAGRAIQEIKKSLKKAGHSKENIDLAIKQVHQRKTILISEMVITLIIVIIATSFGVKELLKEPEYIPQEPKKAPIVTLLPDEELYIQAVLTGNRELCLEIQDEYVRQTCLDYFDNPTPTTTLLEEEEEFRNMLRGNETTCEDLKDDYLRQECLEASEKATSATSDEDIYRQAIITGDYELCEEIQDESIKESCHELVG